MTPLSDGNQDAFISTSRYLDDLLDIDNPGIKKWPIKFIHLNCN